MTYRTETHYSCRTAATSNHPVKRQTGRSEACLRNNPAADFLPPCCPLTFNLVG
ncbi:hypothetical protein GYM25_005219 [Escherichia coli]|nr:hypothetical protein [Escherichia coli]EFJ3992844.1 hypothetical protein [Escherichia coli]